ncbi:hypothetical protein AB0L59_25685 [Streptomyces sp. NPDC052109]|uniref:hypothetical protein n=1 Tax=Streptomyces sp. NPDC052109 TaxID=3155527 RepID=UPI0034169B8D
MNTPDSRNASLKKDADLREELGVTVRARGELGDDYDSALVDSFLEKVERRIDDAVDRRVRRQLAEERMESARGARRPKDADTWTQRFGFAVISLVLAMPLSAISGALAGIGGTIATWVGIVGVNFAQAVRLNPDLLSGRGDRSGRQD